MQSNGWVKIENDSGTGGTTVYAVVLELNTGRTVDRVQTVTGRTAHGDEGTATIIQPAKGVFVAIDHIEDTNGNTVTALADAAGDYFIVGYANVDAIEAVETSDNAYTDIADPQGRLYDDGFTIIDNGTTYAHIEPEQTISLQPQFSGVTPVIGTERQYTFKIPFYAYANKSDARIVSFLVSDGDSETDTVSIRQSGVSV